MTRCQRFPAAALLGAAIWAASIVGADAAGLRASVSTSEVALGDALQLTLQAGAQDTVPPDLSPLNDRFDILGTSRSSQTSIINGARSDMLSWIVTLAPKEKGALEIPSISAGAVSSDPIVIRVVDAASLPEGQASADGLAVTVDVQGGTHYVQQEIPVTVRIEAVAGLQDAALQVPAAPEVLLTQTGEDRTSQVTRSGVPRTVIERDYLLRPQKSGRLTLPSFTLQGRMQEPNSRQSRFAGSPFGSLFGRSMFDDLLNPGKPISVRSEPVTLEIKASPATGQNGWFLPAKSVMLQAEWEPKSPNFRVGEAVQRDIRIVALGAAPEQLPDIALPAVDGVRVYTEHTDARSVDTPDGTAAMRETVVSVVPTRSGEILLPEIRIDWWDVGKDQAATATIPAETITAVAAAPGTAAAEPAIARQPTASAALAPEPHRSPSTAEQAPMLVLGGVLAAALLAALGVLAYRSRPGYRPDPLNQPRPAGNAAVGTTVIGTKTETARKTAALTALRTACAGGDARAIYAALSAWRLQAGLSSPASLAQTTPELVRQITALEDQLFGSCQSGVFDPKTLLKEVLQSDRQRAQAPKNPSTGPILPALYPDVTKPFV